MLLKNAANSASSGVDLNSSKSNIVNNPSQNPTLDQNSDAISANNSLNSNSNKNKLESFDAKILKNSQGVQYRKLCQKIGFDLTSVGQLMVNLKFCDRLPEFLYSLNLPTNQTTQSSGSSQVSHLPLTKSLSNNQITSLTTQDKPNCKIYFTVSVDSVSMKNLMEKQICKEEWPLFEYELTRTSLNQSLGIYYVETFFVNKTEVVVQKIMPNSLASSMAFKVFDIVYSLNQIRITSIKQLNKIVQKAGINSKLKFVMQRPGIILNKKVLTSSSSLVIKRQDSIEPLSIDTSMGATIGAIPENSITPNNQISSSLLSNQTNSSVNSAISAPTSIVSNTRQKLGRLEQRLKSSFGTIGNLFYLKFSFKIL